MILLFLIPVLADVLRGRDGCRCPNGGCGCMPKYPVEPTKPPPLPPSVPRPVMHDFYTYPPPLLGGEVPPPPLMPLPQLPKIASAMLPKLGPRLQPAPKPPAPDRTPPTTTQPPLVVKIGDVLEGQDEFSKWRKVNITKVNGTGWEADVSSDGKNFDFHWDHVYYDFLRSTKMPRTREPTTTTTTTTTTMTPYTTTTTTTTTFMFVAPKAATKPPPMHIRGLRDGQWVRKLLPPCNGTGFNVTEPTPLPPCPLTCNCNVTLTPTNATSNATTVTTNATQHADVTSFLSRSL